MTSGLPERKRPARFPVVESFNRSNVVLLTVCTDRRRQLLARPEAVAILVAAWDVAKDWLVGRYVILPDHLHLFCTPATMAAPEIGRWVKYWKAIATKAWPWPDEKPIWQQGCWDRQLRNGEHYSGRWAYVRNNPVRHGYVASSDDWPWQGEIVPFRFHD